MKQCKYYDKDGDAWDKPCGYSKSSTCKYFNPRYYCPVYKQMNEGAGNRSLQNLWKNICFWKK